MQQLPRLREVLMPFEPYERAGELERFGESDKVQSRNTLELGTEAYQEFHARHRAGAPPPDYCC